MNNLLPIAIVALVLVVIAIVIFVMYYRRSTREFSLIRTGWGGRKVVMDGGVLVLPYLHDVIKVNMQTLRFEVNRSGEQALITKDRMRVDVGVEFYVSVDPTIEAVSRASQTLGNKTFHPEKLRELVEGKLVDTLRSVAAKMSLDELHENRADFVAEVQQNISESLSRNGLALESVSLTSLDQTPFHALDENNAFNAVGMRRLAEVIAESKKERARIDRDAEVEVHRSAMEATKIKLAIDLEQQSAELEQIREIEVLRANQLAEIAAQKAESETAKNAARIKMERSIRYEDIAKEQAITQAEIAQSTAIQEAEQDRNIAVANRSQDVSRALAAADLAKAEAVAAAESITTARTLAEAERKKQLALMQAEQQSAVTTEQLVAQAKAEALAAVETAKATLESASAEAEASKFRINTMRSKMSAEAEARKAFNEADNLLDAEIVGLKKDLARLEALPKIVAEMVKPAEKIDSVNIHHISGLRGEGSGSSGDASNTNKPVVNQALDSVMEMAVQLPALKKLGEELGLSLDKGVSGVTNEPKSE